MEYEAESEIGVNGYKFPFEDEEEFSFEDEEEFSFEDEEGEVPKSAVYFTSPVATDEDDAISNAFQQILDINNEMYSTIDYEAELKKRGAPFKYGLVNLYLLKFPFEDEEDVPNSEYYTSENDQEFIYPNSLEVVKRFLKQVRESNGYDVDCCPPGLCSPFNPQDLNAADKNFVNHVVRMTHFAVEKINAEKGKTYQLVQIEKVVYTDNLLFFLLTFTVKEACTNVDASLKTIRAMVSRVHGNDCDYELEEWMFKPPAQIE